MTNHPALKLPPRLKLPSHPTWLLGALLCLLIVFAGPVSIAASEIPPPDGRQEAIADSQPNSTTLAIAGPAIASQTNLASDSEKEKSDSPVAEEPIMAEAEHNPWNIKNPLKSEPLVGQSDPFSPLQAMVKSIGALALVIGLMLLLAIVVKKLGFNRQLLGQGDLIKVLASRSLGPRKHLMVVAAAEEYFLISVGEQDINLLARLDQQKIGHEMLQLKQPKSDNQESGGRFAAILSNLVKNGLNSRSKR